MGKSAHKVSCDEAKLAPVLALHPRRAFRSEPLVEHELERLRAGEPAAVAALYDQHHAALRAFCQRLLGDAAAAEDLVHDTFVGLPRALAGYRSDAPLRTFLFGVAVNHCRHHLRAAARRRRAMARYAEAAPPEAATLHDLRSEQARATSGVSEPGVEPSSGKGESSIPLCSAEIREPGPRQLPTYDAHGRSLVDKVRGFRRRPSTKLSTRDRDTATRGSASYGEALDAARNPSTEAVLVRPIA